MIVASYGRDHLTHDSVPWTARDPDRAMPGSVIDCEDGAELLKIVERFGVDLVVIDTVSRTISGKENDSDTWLQWYRNTGLSLKHAGVALLRLDHAGKDETCGPRGSSAKSSDVDVVFHLTGDSGGRLWLKPEGQCQPHYLKSAEFLRTTETVCSSTRS